MNMVAGGERIAIETNNSAKPVIQYDLKGNCIAKYNSQLEAAASVGLLDSTAISLLNQVRLKVLYEDLRAIY